jgi:hypothetical protein
MITQYKTPRFGLAFMELLLIVTVGIVCWCQAARDIENRPEPLILLPSAFDVQYATFEGRPQMIYRLHADYPAELTLNTISTKLGEAGWKPLKSDFWNPSGRHVYGGMAAI